MINDQMMEVTRIFSEPKSADVIVHNNPFFSPSHDDLWKLQPFPLITRLMDRINEIGIDEKVDRFQKIVRHVSDLMIMTQAATKHLREFL